MKESKYLIVGSSHAGLSAVDAIRVWDPKGSMTLLTREDRLPYSPTILPYVVSGHAEPEKAFLRTERDLESLDVSLQRGAEVTALDAVDHCVTLASGGMWAYEKLLLATGSGPVLPPLEGLESVPFHVLRTMSDALGIRQAMERRKSVIVLGAGFIGMHAAENLSGAGLEVTLIEALGQILPGYLDAEAADLIQKEFEEKGVRILTGQKAERVEGADDQCRLSLASGKKVKADMLLAATGVRPNRSYLNGSRVDADRGILVDERMRSSIPDIWAAGDVAQAKDFFGDGRILNPTVPNAVEQGCTAGMDMAGDPSLRPYEGAISMNTYSFFGHQSFALGLASRPGPEEGVETDRVFLPREFRYQKLVYRENRLIGAAGINCESDAGVLYQLIRRRIDLSDIRAAFAHDPLGAGRIMMTRIWR